MQVEKMVQANGNQANYCMVELAHDPGLSLDWSAEEQIILEDGLNMCGSDGAFQELCGSYANEATVLAKYLKIADHLPDKTVRDVALRCKWMTNFAATSAVPTYTPRPPPIDNDDGISEDVIGGITGRLFEQNAQIIAQIRSNLAACKLQEDTELLSKFRDNILAIMEGMTIMPGIMSQMPALPVNLNTELADQILPKPLHPATSSPMFVQ